MHTEQHQRDNLDAHGSKVGSVLAVDSFTRNEGHTSVSDTTVQDSSGSPGDPPAGPSAVVAIRSGGLATSSTVARRWRRGGDVLHHILDPRTGLPAAPVWRTVSVSAASCTDANIASTAAIIRGRAAPAWLTGLGLPARLVDEAGRVHRVGGWPAEAGDTR